MSESSNSSTVVPDIIPILCLRTTVLFPDSIIPIDVGRRKSLRLFKDVDVGGPACIGVLTQKDEHTQDPGLSDLRHIGCTAKVIKVIELADNNFSVVLQGVARIRVAGLEKTEPFNVAKAVAVPDEGQNDLQLEELMGQMQDLAYGVIKLRPELPSEARAMVDTITEPGRLADLIASNLELQPDEKQKVLETFNLHDRVRLVSTFLSREIENLNRRV